MRIITFTQSTGVHVYPDDKSQFKKTRYHEGNIVGEYYGSDGNIDSYVGTWPEPVVRYKTQVTRREFKLLFTPTEYRAVHALTSTDDAVFQLWDVAQTTNPIDMTCQEVVDGITNVCTGVNGLPTAQRGVEILKGVQE